MQEEARDKVSDWIKRAIDILFCSHPKRTSLGIVLGMVLNAVFGILLRPIIERSTPVNIAGLNIWHYIPIGIFVMHTPTIYHSLKQSSELPEEVERALQLLRQAQRERAISKQQTGEFYLKILTFPIYSFGMCSCGFLVHPP
jgi:hypothetical protein